MQGTIADFKYMPENTKNIISLFTFKDQDTMSWYIYIYIYIYSTK